jgi:hypothetical protein
MTRADVPTSRATRVDALGPFGHRAQDEDRFAKRRRFLLDATGVREDDVAAVEQRDEREVVERRQ